MAISETRVTACKMLRPMLSDHSLSVCDVGILWPNGWMDQDATWYSGRPWPRQHCVRWGLRSRPQKRGTAHSSPALFGSSIVARWLDESRIFKMPFGTEVGLRPGHIVLDGNPALPPQEKRTAAPLIFSPCLLW